MNTLNKNAVTANVPTHTSKKGECDVKTTIRFLNEIRKNTSNIAIKAAALSFAIASVLSCVAVNNTYASPLASPENESVTLTQRAARVYPSEAEMLNLYLYMNVTGQLQPGTGVLSPNVTEELLREVYDYALDNIKVPPGNNINIIADPLGVKGKEPQPLLPVSKSRSAACLTAVDVCLTSTIGATTACAAATFTWGALLPADALCAGLVVGGVAGCGGAIAACTHKDGVLSSYESLVIGTAGAKSQRKYCSVLQKFRALRVFQNADGYPNRLEAICSDDEVLSFGADDNAQKTVSCDAPGDYLVAGFQTRSGSWVNAIGLECDKVRSPKANSTALIGTSNPSIVKNLCPAGQYVHGLQVWSNPRVADNQRVLSAIRFYCF